MEFYPGFDISPQQEPFGFCYGKGVFGPEAEIRRLDDIRASLEDPGCAGPEAVYAISMDVGMEEDREEIEKRNLLYGALPGAYPRREHFLRFLHAGSVRDLGRPGDYLYAGVRGGRSRGLLRNLRRSWGRGHRAALLGPRHGQRGREPAHDLRGLVRAGLRV